MRRSLLFLTCVMALTVAASHSNASIVQFTLGTLANPPSFISINLDNGGFQQSPITGTATLDLSEHSTSSGTAQITALSLTLTNGLSFPASVSSNGTSTSGSTAAGDLSFSLVTPGAAGTLIPPAQGPGGNFDQLGNQLAADGDLILNLPAGATTFDLSNLSINLVDFILSGVAPAAAFDPTAGPNDLLLGGVFGIEEELEVNGEIIPFVAIGQFSGIGTKPEKPVSTPEPGSTMVLIGIGTVWLTRRRR